MYAVSYTVMCMPVKMFYETKEEAEEMKKKVEAKLPGVVVTIEG